MGGGNAQKSKMARERNAEKNKGGKGKYPTDACPPPAPAAALCSPSRISALYLLAGSQLEANKKAMNIQVSSSSCLPCVPVEILGVFPDSLGFQATPSGFGRSSHGAILEP
jgi:hypothetical protein